MCVIKYIKYEAVTKNPLESEEVERQRTTSGQVATRAKAPPTELSSQVKMPPSGLVGKMPPGPKSLFTEWRGVCRKSASRTARSVDVWREGEVQGAQESRRTSTPKTSVNTEYHEQRLSTFADVLRHNTNDTTCYSLNKLVRKLRGQ